MQTGDFDSVYRRFAGAVLGFARRCVGRADIAEEVASEAFIELLRNMDKIDQDQLPAWLYTVVRNRAIDYWRRRKLEAEYLEGRSRQPAPEAPPFDWSVLEHEKLNRSHRLCLTLRYVHGMSREEIAQFTGLREAQVKGYLRYGLELLRQTFTGPGGGKRS